MVVSEDNLFCPLMFDLEGVFFRESSRVSEGAREHEGAGVSRAANIQLQTLVKLPHGRFTSTFIAYFRDFLEKQHRTRCVAF